MFEWLLSNWMQTIPADLPTTEMSRSDAIGFSQMLHRA